MSIRLAVLAGARPNFMKVAPLMAAIAQDENFETILIHTGQHYDEKMSKLFFEELKIPRPDIDLGVGSGSHAVQTAEVMKRIEPVLLEQKADAILVVGDVNSTVACALDGCQARGPRNPRRGGPAQLRSHDARGNQSRPDRCHL